ncbi:hypothetical protein R6Z07F_002111 [Ovis aries]
MSCAVWSRVLWTARQASDSLHRSQWQLDQSRREVSLNLSQVACGLRGNMRIYGWRLTSRAGSEQKRSLPESQPGCTWPEGKHEDLWLEARQPSKSLLSTSCTARTDETMEL